MRQIKENITGHGLDIPLLGIREACRALGKTNQIFDDVYATSNQFKLSTSQVNWKKLFENMYQILFLGGDTVLERRYYF